MRSNDPMSMIIGKLNESVKNSVEIESTVGVDQPTDFHQCKACSGTYKGEQDTCPICGISQAYQVVAENEDALEVKDDEVKDEVKVEESDDEIKATSADEEVPDDVKKEVNEAMKMLTKGEYKKFNEAYGKTSKLMKNGQLNILVESERTGRIYSVARRMSSIQKANFKLSESVTRNSAVSRRTRSSAKLESVRKARAGIAALTEMSAVKVAMMKMMERQGIQYNHKALNEAIKSTINERYYKFMKKLEAIEADKETGAVSFDESTPEEIAQDVVSVIKDAGLDVVSNTTEVDASDKATVEVRVQDDPDLEVNLEPVADAISDVVDAPVAIVGPSIPEGDSTLADLQVLINPDDEVVKECDEMSFEDEEKKVAISESLRRRYARRINEGEEDYKLNTNLKVVDEDDEEDDEVEDEIEVKTTEACGGKKKKKMECDDPEFSKVPKLSERASRNSRVRKISEGEGCDKDTEVSDEKSVTAVSEGKVKPLRSKKNKFECDDNGEIKISESFKLRPFTSSDYYGYAGAMDFSDGSKPMIAELDSADIVVSPNEDGEIMTEVDYADGEKFSSYYALSDSKDEAVAKAQKAAKLIEDGSFEDKFRSIGFMKIM